MTSKSSVNFLSNQVWVLFCTNSGKIRIFSPFYSVGIGFAQTRVTSPDIARISRNQIGLCTDVVRSVVINWYREVDGCVRRSCAKKAILAWVITDVLGVVSYGVYYQDWYIFETDIEIKHIMIAPVPLLYHLFNSLLFSFTSFIFQDLIRYTVFLGTLLHVLGYACFWW